MFLNTSSGVVTTDVLDGIADQAIQIGPAYQNIYKAYRLNGNRDGKLSPFHIVFLTFEVSKLPSAIIL
jgi:hypothetical protein